MNKTIALAAALLFSVGVFAQAKLKDTQIAKVALTINDGEIDAAKYAKGKVKNEEVKSFANMMIDEHEQNIKDTKNLAKQEKFTPEKSDLSKSLESDVKASNKDLKKSDKASVDKAYVDQQVMLHQKALDTFDTVLIPQAENPALKAHMEKTRAAVAGHLAHAKTLQTKIK